MEKQLYCHDGAAQMLARPWAIFHFLCVSQLTSCPEVYLSICLFTANLGQYTTDRLAQRYALIATPLYSVAGVHCFTESRIRIRVIFHLFESWSSLKKIFIKLYLTPKIVLERHGFEFYELKDSLIFVFIKKIKKERKKERQECI